MATRLEETHTAEYAETVCDRVSKLKIYNATSNLGYLTISIGFVICQPQDGETQQELIDQAKQGLQRAKD